MESLSIEDARRQLGELRPRAPCWRADSDHALPQARRGRRERGVVRARRRSARRKRGIVTGRCAHIARTDARRISGPTEAVASNYGKPDLHFRVFESVRIHFLHVQRALLMRFGSDPIRGSNPRSSAERRSMLVELRSTAPRPAVSSRGDDPPDPPMSAPPTKAGGAPLSPGSPMFGAARLTVGGLLPVCRWAGYSPPNDTRGQSPIERLLAGGELVRDGAQVGYV